MVDFKTLKPIIDSMIFKKAIWGSSPEVRNKK